MASVLDFDPPTPKMAPSYTASVPVQVEQPVDTSHLEDSALEKPYREAYARWQTGRSPDSNSKLLESINPILRTAVRSYAGPSASPLATTQAKLIALKAIEKYDPQQGKLSTFLHRHLQGLRRHAAESSAVIHVPEQIRLQRHHLYEAERELRDELGRDPSDVEISDRTGLPSKRIENIRSYRTALPEAVFGIRQGPEGIEAGAPAVADRQTDNDLARLRGLVYDSYPDTQSGNLKRLIMERYFGMRGRPKTSFQEIATKAGLTRGRVSQVVADIQADLDAAERHDVLR